MLSKIPTAGALEKKLFKFSFETFGSLEKVLTFAAAIERNATSSLKDLHINK